MDYQEMYFTLFNKLTDIITEMQAIQCQMEEHYISSDLDCDEDTTI